MGSPRALDRLGLCCALTCFASALVTVALRATGFAGTWRTTRAYGFATQIGMLHKAQPFIAQPKLVGIPGGP